MNLSKQYPHYCSTHNVYYGSPTDTIQATMCPICGIAKELVEEMEKLETELRHLHQIPGKENAAGVGYMAAIKYCADRLSALIQRHRGKS